MACWGDNEFGQLGDGTDFNLSVVAKPVPGIEDAVFISAGDDSTCVIRSGGAVTCWGRVHSTIEFGEIRAFREPVPVLGLPEPMVRLSVGWATHTCAVGESGAVYCWGRGILGTGESSVETSGSPLRVLGVDNAVDVSVGGAHTCVGLATGNYECWGGNSRGQVGDGSFSLRPQPVPIRDPG